MGYILMTPWPEQVDLANKVYAVLKAKGLAYLAAEERTGKTLAAILVAEKTPAKTVLVVTKKKPMVDWIKTVEAYDSKLDIKVTNYHNAHKADRADLVILDEAHNYISSFPKPGLIWKQLKPLCKHVPILYLSATPYAQGPQMLYHQFALSSYSPWKLYPTFYSWFKTFGEPYQIEINSMAVNQYDRCKVDFAIACVEDLFVTATRKSLGFTQEPTDKLHYIELNDNTKAVYNEVIEHEIVELSVGWLVCDTNSKLRYSLHQLEGGTIKIDNLYYVLANQEKADYILEHFGDTENLVIMYNYKAEKEKLSVLFKHATILQATSYAEGIDLHQYDDLVIYSQDFSTARHTQRRARQANRNRKTPIVVHHLLVKKGLSEQVYKTVSVNKKNFVDSVFERDLL
jgi:hypothetical protein